MKEIKIYGLSSSREPNNIRYIGKTSKKLKYRLSTHLYYTRKGKSHKDNWILKELSDGFEIIITEIFLVPEDESWEEWEKYYIKEYKERGYKLTNLTEGGEGLHGEENPFYGKNHTEESIKNNKLNQPYRKVVNQYDLGGNLLRTYKSISEAAREAELSKTSISDVCNGKEKCNTAGGFVWRFDGDEFSLEYKNPAEKLKKVVCQYSKTGELLNEFDSTLDAQEKTNTPSPNISRCCNGYLKTAGGFVWRYKGDEFSLDKTRKDAKSVIQYSLSGAYIAEFNSISEASEKTGVYYSGIYFSCKGKYKTAGGFIWKFKD